MSDFGGWMFKIDKFFYFTLIDANALKVNLIGMMEKWEDKKYEGDEKSGMIEIKDFSLSYLCLVRRGKVEGLKTSSFFSWEEK